MSAGLETGVYVFVLATFLGFEVIPRVPKLLHTPLMALTNAISGVALVGSLVVAGAQTTALLPIVAVLALAFGAMLIIPIGGADMPTVISLLNSYAGLSGAAMGSCSATRS